MESILGTGDLAIAYVVAAQFLGLGATGLVALLGGWAVRRARARRLARLVAQELAPELGAQPEPVGPSGLGGQPGLVG